MSSINKKMAPTGSSSEHKTIKKSRYFLTWRWHFYAGLFVVPFMLMLCFTGIVMLFDEEIEQFRYQPIISVEVGEQTAAVSEQLLAVEKHFPDSTVTQFIPAKQADLANRFNVRHQDGSSVFVTVNPYSGEVLGEIDRSDSWYQLANDIHGTLLIGDMGDYLIEVAASLSILLLVTGVYMWLPTDNATKSGFLRLRFSQGSRILLRDLHANIGGVFALVLLFFVLSGLAWAGFWGGKMVQAWSSFPAQKWDEVPLSNLTHKDLNHGSEEELPWNLEQTPVPASHDHANMGHEAMETNRSFASQIDHIVRQGEQLGFTDYRLNLPRSETGVFTFTANTMSGDITNPTQDRTTHIDQYSHQVLADVTWQDYNLMAKAMAAGIALHTGDITPVNKWANVMVCLLFIAVSISGVIMWWQRRPSGQKRLGVPPCFEHNGLWRTGVFTVVLTGVCFPLAGLTIVAMLLLDWVLFSRVKSLQYALS